MLVKNILEWSGVAYTWMSGQDIPGRYEVKVMNGQREIDSKAAAARDFMPELGPIVGPTAV
jgi:hypothetical protein